MWWQISHLGVGKFMKHDRLPGYTLHHVGSEPKNISLGGFEGDGRSN